MTLKTVSCVACDLFLYHVWQWSGMASALDGGSECLGPRPVLSGNSFMTLESYLAYFIL